MFRSNYYYDQGIQHCHDFLIKTVVQCTMSRQNDFHYSIYLWSQYEGGIIRSKLLKNHTEMENEQFDSDDLITEQDVID